MDKTKKYQIGLQVYSLTNNMGPWVAGGGCAITFMAMEKLIEDGIATEVKEKFKGSMVVTMGNVGYVNSCTKTDGIVEWADIGNILRGTLGGASAVASK